MVKWNVVPGKHSAMSWYRNLCGLLPAAQPPNGTRTGLDRVQQETSDVTEFILSEFIRQKDNFIPTHSSLIKVCDTMRTLVTKVVESDGNRFSDLAAEMDLQKLKSDPRLVLYAVLDSMFEDGRIHWLRIVAAYVYAVKLAERCSSEKAEELGVEVVRTVGEYIGDDIIAQWILTQGGWKNITTVFVDANDLEQKLKSAGYLALAVGFGALLSVVASR